MESSEDEREERGSGDTGIEEEEIAEEDAADDAGKVGTDDESSDCDDDEDCDGAEDEGRSLEWKVRVCC